ncbi:MAG: 30S ribosomal protein S6 [Acidobacteria bacterium]|nr:30S ribosomal protein S6 [Acidobacteriota bacterium]MBI3473565.1 30S ribosomal protein S6 [Candidatus Solibacter usitatus]
MRIYEELFIIKPDATEEEIDQVIEQLSGVVKSGGGTVDKVEKWGKRRLAYRVDKYREGSYVLIQLSAGPELVKELERRLRVTDAVIKFLTVRIDETLKRLEKRKKQRDKRAHRKSVAAPATPMPSMAQQMMTEPGIEKESL